MCYSFTSSSSSSVTSQSSLRSSPDNLRFGTRDSSKDESFESSVFDSPTIPEKPYPKLSVSDVTFAIGVDDEDRDDEMNDRHEEEEIHTRIIFGKITSEDKYVQPNEPDEDLVDSIKSHIENRKLSGKELSNIQETIIEEDACSTYVHLIDDDDDEPSGLTTHELFQSITKSLENPQQHNFADHHGKYMPAKSKSLHESSAVPKNNEVRRASEPTKSIHSVQRNDHKKKLQKESYSMDHEYENQTTPKGSPFSFRKKPTAVKQNSFPKNSSISQHKSQGISAFNIAEKLFTTYDAGITNKTNFSKFQQSISSKRKNILSINKYPTSKSHPNLKLPDLDRNTKPKSLPSNNDTKNKSSSESIASEEDSPPPIPERQSPIVRNEKKQTSLQRSEEVDKSDDDMLTEQLASEKNNEGMTLLPPPLPPKSKPLQLTKSAPLSQSQSFDDEEPRRSSFSTLPREGKEETDEPPTIPSRDHIPIVS